MRLEIAGENALMVYFGDSIDEHLSDQVQRCVQALDAAVGQRITDIIPAYASVLVQFDPLQYSHRQIARYVSERLAQETQHASSSGRTVELPVYYAPESGPDLVDLARAKSLSIEEFVDIHCATTYRVYAIGFAPGFGYLGEVDERIAAARHASPRDRVAAGSVGIADRQTAVYPTASPGGWNIIGCCPVTLFDPAADSPLPFAVGDSIQFTAIGRAEFFDLGGSLA